VLETKNEGLTTQIIQLTGLVNQNKPLKFVNALTLAELSELIVSVCHLTGEDFFVWEETPHVPRLLFLSNAKNAIVKHLQHLIDERKNVNANFNKDGQPDDDNDHEKEPEFLGFHHQNLERRQGW